MDRGRPRVSASRSSTALTRVPVIEVSTSRATHSRVQSSTIARHRSRRPSANPSDTKSIDQLRLAAVGCGWLWQRLAFKRSYAFTLATPHRKTGFPVQPVRALTVDRPAFAPQQNMDASIAVAALHRRDLFDPRTYSAALRSPAAIAVQRARDKYQPARARHTEVPFRHQHGHRFAPRLRAHHFRPRRSFRAALSSSASASSLLSLLFSASSSLRRLASDTVIPAYFAFQLWKVASDIPWRRHSSF